ncbi:hypothetical protein [Hydrogenophaga atypica]|uniref:Uncharacterized protein n=1 Tax=Hydrogenophaga atypica TaxID=249409 RepID=A0ABW2QMR7_9BURK
MVLSFKKAYLAAEKALTTPCGVDASKIPHDSFTREAEATPSSLSNAPDLDSVERTANHEAFGDASDINSAHFNESRPKIEADYEEGTLQVPHLGITLRVLLAAASNACEGKKIKRNWNLWYNNAKIGTVRIKTQD